MSIKKEFEAWKKETGSHGRMAYPRFVMLRFLEELNEVSDQFVFKGGNLLWFYIKTPRPTIDLDLSSSTEMSKEQFLAIVEQINQRSEGLSFKVVNIIEIISEVKVGLKCDVEFRDDTGGNNKFGIDIVFGIPTDLKLIQIRKTVLNAASIENIIIDKVSAAHSFGSGNTRGKDFDDLYRLAIDESIEVNSIAVRAIARKRGVDLELRNSWICEDLQINWQRHLQKAYRRKNDLPTELDEVFGVINDFLSKLRKQ